jgi:hypothetical protein
MNLRFLKYPLFTILLFCGIVHGQSITNRDVVQGVNYFYEASFSEALDTFEQLISQGDLTEENLFAAHLYSGFCHIRQEADSELIFSHFVEAIGVNPKIDVDYRRLPPDLYEQYLNVRLQVLGHLVFHSQPSSASLLLFEQNSSKIIRHYTPVEIRDLMVGNYELVIAKDGFMPQTAQIEVRPNKTDTLEFVLEEKQVSLVKKYWPWAGGFVVTTALVLSQMFDNEAEEPEKNTLPEPPVRPTNP